MRFYLVGGRDYKTEDWAVRVNGVEIEAAFITRHDVPLEGRPRVEVSLTAQLPSGQVVTITGSDAEMFEVSTGIRSVAENRFDTWFLHKEAQGTVP